MPAVDQKNNNQAVPLTSVVSGSFKKFKPEIDAAIDRLQGNSVIVLAPDKGWLYVPTMRVCSAADLEFRPLPSERGMEPGQVELDFLEKLKNADFVYLVNPGGYVGISVCLEIGAAMARKIPVYAAEAIRADLDPDLFWARYIRYVKVATVEEAIALERSLRKP